MFKKYPQDIPEENKKIIAVHNGKAYVTEYIRMNEKVPENELPEGILQAIRKSENRWFADVPLSKEDYLSGEYKNMVVHFIDFPEELTDPS